MKTSAGVKAGKYRIDEERGGLIAPAAVQYGGRRHESCQLREAKAEGRLLAEEIKAYKENQREKAKAAKSEIMPLKPRAKKEIKPEYRVGSNGSLLSRGGEAAATAEENPKAYLQLMQCRQA